MTPNNDIPSSGATNLDPVEPFIDKVEAARRLNCSVRSIDNWMSRGVIPFYKIGRKVGFKWSEVEEALRAKCRVNRGGWSRS